MMTGVTEILVVLAIAAVFFGPGKLPQVMGALGQGMKTFRRSADEVARGDEDPTPRSGGSATS